MNIDELTIGQAKELNNLFGNQPAKNHPWEIGKIYLIRTVTMIETGILVDVTDQELVLEEAAWIADTGRFSEAVAKAEFDEVEPFPSGPVIVGRGSVIDAVQINKTPRSLK
jgi:hypothetical protein